MRINSHSKGIVLLMVLGILSLMSVLAITFVKMARLERAVSKNYVDHARAMLLSESGVEYAIARLSNFESATLTASESKELSWSTSKVSFSLPGNNEISGFVSSSYVADGDYFKLWVSDESGKLNLNDTDGEWNIDTDPISDKPGDPGYEVGLSRLRTLLSDLGEILFGDLANPTGIGNVLSTKIFAARTALGGQFSDLSEVHDALLPDPSFSEADWEIFLKHITIWSWQDPNVIRPNFKLDISVPAGEMQLDDDFGIYMWSDFQNKGYELEPRCPVNVNSCSRELLQALILPLQGWYLKEGPASTISVSSYGGWAGGSRNDIAATTSNRYFTMFYHVDDPVIEPSPIDGADAFLSRNDPLATGVSVAMTNGVFPAPHDLDPPRNELNLGGTISNRYGMMKLTEEFSLGQSLSIATKIHDRIQNGDPFETWEEFHDFIKNKNGDGLTERDVLPDDDMLEVDPGIRALASATARPRTTIDQLPTAPVDEQSWWRNYYFEIYTDLLIAMFNPNSDLNDYNPNRNLYRSIDKGQLTHYTTELCLAPTGTYKIISKGLVTSTSGFLAESSIETRIEIFTPVRFTTQSQFMSGVEGNADELDDYFTKSTRSPVLHTFGSSNLDSTGSGYTLQSYPEPYMSTAVDQIQNSKFDGQLMLATYENQDSAVDALGGCLKVSFEESLKPGVFGNNPVAPPSLSPSFPALDTLYLNAPGIGNSHEPNATGYHFSEGYNYPTTEPLTWRRDAALDTDVNNLSGVLYPDGGFSEAGRTLGYLVGNVYDITGQLAQNLGYRYSMSFWVKPNFHTGLSNRVRKLLTFDSSMAFKPSFPGLYYFPHAFEYDDINNSQKNPPAWNNLSSLGMWSQLKLSVGHGPSWMVSRSLSVITETNTDTTVIPFVSAIDNRGGILSYRTSHDFPKHNAARDDSSLPRMNFEGHTWTHCTVGQEIASAPLTFFSVTPGQFASLGINGWSPPVISPIDPDSRFKSSWTYNIPFPTHDMRITKRNTPRYYRFGEFNTGEITRYMADSTIDEVTFLPILPGAAMYAYDAAMKATWINGRYLNAIDPQKTVAVYTSKAFTLKDLGIQFSTERYTIKNVSWTLYWPRNNRGVDAGSGAMDEITDNILGVEMNPNDTVDPTIPNRWDPISVDVFTTNSGWAYNSNSTPEKESMPSYAGGSKIEEFATGQSPYINKNDEFQFKVYFNLGNNAAADISLYESPVLDDITFHFMHRKPKILRWKVLTK